MTTAPVIVVDSLDPGWQEKADACLSRDEIERSLRFLRPTDQHAWRAGRAWVRHQLAAALNTAPASLVFAVTKNGRPRVDGAPPGFDANWSHSGHWMALAYGWNGPVGIDIEVYRPEFPVDDIAPTVCTPDELAFLAQVGTPSEKSRRFFHLWTAKEALMKATGLGVAMDPASIELEIVEGGPVGYRHHPDYHLRTQETSDWIAAWTVEADVQPPGLTASSSINDSL
jgi:4'-phosphopantetheinyl transferase